MTEWQSMLESLRQPAYVHVLLNPLPVYGMICGILALLAAVALRSRPAQIVGLGLVVLACAAVWPVIAFGEDAHRQIEQVADPAGAEWIEVHEHRAEDAVWVYIVTGVVALAAIVVPAKLPRVRGALLLAALVLAIVSTGVGAWIGHAGGQVRHSEFRHAPPPAASEEHEQHEEH